jgi:hypothetical protein
MKLEGLETLVKKMEVFSQLQLSYLLIFNLQDSINPGDKTKHMNLRRKKTMIVKMKVIKMTRQPIIPLCVEGYKLVLIYALALKSSP